jgi:general secretion pathway protein D
MSHHMVNFSVFTPCLRALCAALLALQLANAHAAPQVVAPGEPVTLNFVDADLEDVARTMAVLSRRNVVVDPRVKGKLTLTTETPVSARQALDQFASALRLRGFAMVDTNGLIKVVPEAEAKLQTTGVSVRSPRLSPGGEVVTQIFQLVHEEANNLVPVLRPLIGPNNTINVSPGSNALVITDYAENLVRIEKIIAALDVGDALDVAMVPLRNGVASDVAAMLKILLEAERSSSAPGAKTSGASASTTILAEPRGNALIVRAPNATRLQQVQNLIAKLDVPVGDQGEIHVVHLKNAQAKDLAVTLRAAMGAQSPTSTPSSAPGSKSATASGANTGGMIQADEATNSLIITAPAPQMRQLRSVIDQLDGRRAQVFVESLIAEVNADKAAEFGIQWQGPIGNAGDAVVGLIGTNFGAAGANIISLATGGGTVAPTNGLNVGVAQRKNGVYVLGFLGRFLQENGDANILSTPTLLTLDNEEAKIVIGKNVPFVTGQYTNNNSNSGSVNPFQTIERKDVGLTLKVRPQISENGTIKMDIYQEVSNVSDTTTAGLVTNKRSIESSVLVDDGQIVVLGGLLQDEYVSNKQAVPGLSDLPVLGGLFRSESRNRNKTNLMVFLRPVIIQDAKASERLSLSRYDIMRSAQQDAQPAPSETLGINASPVLAPVRAINVNIEGVPTPWQ